MGFNLGGWLSDRWDDFEDSVTDLFEDQVTYQVSVSNNNIIPYDSKAMPTVVKYSYITKQTNHKKSIASQVRDELVRGYTNKFQQLIKSIDDTQQGFQMDVEQCSSYIENYVKEFRTEIKDPHEFTTIPLDTDPTELHERIMIPYEFLFTTNESLYAYNPYDKTITISTYILKSDFGSLHNYMFDTAPTTYDFATPTTITIEDITFHSWAYNEPVDAGHIQYHIIVTGRDSNGDIWYHLINRQFQVFKPTDHTNTDMLIPDTGSTHGRLLWNPDGKLILFKGTLDGIVQLFVHKANEGIYKYEMGNGYVLYDTNVDIYETAHIGEFGNIYKQNKFRPFPTIPLMIDNDNVKDILADENHNRYDACVRGKTTLNILDQDIEKLYDTFMEVPDDLTQEEQDDLDDAHANTTDMYINFGLDIKRNENVNNLALYDYFYYIKRYLNRHPKGTNSRTVDSYKFSYIDKEIGYLNRIQMVDIVEAKFDYNYVYMNDDGKLVRLGVGKVIKKIEPFHTYYNPNGAFQGDHHLYCITLIRQYEGYFTKLTIIDLRQIALIDDGTGSSGYDVIKLDDIVENTGKTIVLPLFMEIVKHMPLFRRIDLFPLLMNLQVQAIQYQHIKWWQTETFGVILQVVAVVIVVVVTIYTAGIETPAAVIALDILITLAVGYASSYALSYIMEHVSNKYLRFILIVVVVVLSVYASGGFDIEALTEMTLSDSVMLASSVINKYVTLESARALKELQEDDKEFFNRYKEEMDKLNKDKFSKIDSIYPDMIRKIKFEFPEGFESRTSISDFPTVTIDSTYMIQDVSLLQNIGYND